MLLHRHRSPSLWSPAVVPTEPVEVDWSHPLSNVLAALYIPGAPNGGMRDLAGQTVSLQPLNAATATTGFVASPGGAGYYHSSSASGLVSAVPPANLTNTGDQTLVWYGCLPLSETTFPFAIGICSDNGGAGKAARAISTWGSGFIVAGTTNLTNTSSTAGSSPAYNNQPVVLAAQFPASGNVRLFVAGVGQNTAAGGTVTYTGTSFINIGCVSGTTQTTNSTTLMAAWWNRVLSAAEIAWISAEPFAMLRPVARRVYRAITPPADPRPAVMNAQTVGASYQPLPNVTPLRSFAPPAPPVAPALDQRRLLNLWQAINTYQPPVVPLVSRQTILPAPPVAPALDQRQLLNLWQALGTYQPATVPLVLRQFLPQFGTAPAAGPTFDPRQLQNLLRAIGTYQLDPQVLRGPTFAPPAPPVAPLFNQRQMTTLAQVASATWMPDPTVPAFLRFRNYPPAGIVPPPLVSGRPVVIWMD